MSLSSWPSVTTVLAIHCKSSNLCTACTFIHADKRSYYFIRHARWTNKYFLNRKNKSKSLSKITLKIMISSMIYQICLCCGIPSPSISVLLCPAEVNLWIVGKVKQSMYGPRSVLPGKHLNTSLFLNERGHNLPFWAAAVTIVPFNSDENPLLCKRH